MRLKDILESANEEQRIKKLHDQLQTGKWIYQRPLLFRGLTVGQDSSLLIKQTTERKEPRDTAGYVDRIIHGFYTNCYPELPHRRESRFATTSLVSARHYGNVYLIFPSYDANISTGQVDPYDIFETMKSKLKLFVGRYHKLHNDYGQEWIDKNMSDELYNIMRAIANLVKGGYDYTDMKDLPCPKALRDKIRSFNISLDEEAYQVLVNDLEIFLPLNLALSEAYQYFKGLEEGYPYNDGTGEEVMFEGEYLQVGINLYTKFAERYDYAIEVGQS